MYQYLISDMLFTCYVLMFYRILSSTCFHMIASHVVFCILSVTWFHLDAISHMLSCWKLSVTCCHGCWQSLAVMLETVSHMLSCGELSVMCCYGCWQSYAVMLKTVSYMLSYGRAVSHMLSWMMTRTCGDECWQSLLCHVGSCQSHIVMDADSHMWSWMLSVTC